MNCDKLHAMLDAKDLEVKTRNEKTEYWFNEIKDDVFGLMANKAIDSEFKGSCMLHQSSVVDIIIGKLGYKDVRLIWKFPVDLNYWMKSFFDTYHPDEARSELAACAFHYFEESIDYELLKSKLMNYLLSRGFRYEWITNIHGNRRKTEFLVISRRDLEESCCTNKVFDIKHQVSDRNEGGCEVDQKAAFIFMIIVFCFVSAFIAITCIL